MGVIYSPLAEERWGLSRSWDEPKDKYSETNTNTDKFVSAITTREPERQDGLISTEAAYGFDETAPLSAVLACARELENLVSESVSHLDRGDHFGADDCLMLAKTKAAELFMLPGKSEGLSLASLELLEGLNSIALASESPDLLQRVLYVTKQVRANPFLSFAKADSLLDHLGTTGDITGYSAVADALIEPHMQPEGRAGD